MLERSLEDDATFAATCVGGVVWVGDRHAARSCLTWSACRLLLCEAYRQQNEDLCKIGRTLLYFLISRTRLLNASSTLMRCFADVSMNRQPKCLARSLPSSRQISVLSVPVGMMQYERKRTMRAYLTLVFEVALVGDDDDRKVVPVFYS